MNDSNNSIRDRVNTLELTAILADIKALDKFENMKMTAALACRAFVFDDADAAVLLVRQAYEALKVAHKSNEQSADEKKILGILAVLIQAAAHKFQE